MTASFNLMRRLPPQDIPKNLSAITGLVEDEDLKVNIEEKTDLPLGKFPSPGKIFCARV